MPETVRRMLAAAACAGFVLVATPAPGVVGGEQRRHENIGVDGHVTGTISQAPPRPVVVVGRADTFTNPDGSRSLSVEAKHTTDPLAVTMTAQWFTADGSQLGQAVMTPHVDAGTYLYHRVQADGILQRPAWVTVTASDSATSDREVGDWLGPLEPGRDGYQIGYVSGYSDSFGYYEQLEDLHESYPELTEMVTLPYLTNGYDRPGMALLGDDDADEDTWVGVTSELMGSQGGTDITVNLRDPDQAESPLTVAVSGVDIVVNLATDGNGSLISTAAQVVAAINEEPAAADLAHAYTYRGSAGAGIVEDTGEIQLEDFLSGEVPRGPIEVKGLRIGRVRDGSNPGVLIYASEHGDEWQTPLIALETANRLLDNYDTDAITAELVDNLDIIILPVVNPDGELYSKYDYPPQRRNMTNYCPVTGDYGLWARHSWGVDINRNYPAYSSFDGYVGGSDVCTNDEFRGPDVDPPELSQPEAANLAWVAETFDNIRFSVGLHSSGNLFMWPPGSYAIPGRLSAPRPTFGQEHFFFDVAHRVLTQVKQYRGLSVSPARTGVLTDVLYPSAGNSPDMLWFDHGIFAFTLAVGELHRPVEEEAIRDAMEYAFGMEGLMRAALAWSNDNSPPTTAAIEQFAATGEAGITFGFSEPVEIYYTTDGSEPTTTSTMYELAGIREGGETLWFDEPTTLRWCAVDMAGNVEAACPRTIQVQPITAEAGGPYVTTLDDVVQFSSEGSHPPPDTDLVAYQWDLGDGTITDVADPEHRYSSLGDFDATLTVTDMRGDYDIEVTDLAAVSVNGADASAPRAVALGETATLSSAGSHPPHGTPGVTYSWQLGDGTVAEGANVVHPFKEPGDVTATLTITDERAGTGVRVADSVEISIAAAVANGPYVGAAGHDVPFTAAGSHPPPGTADVTYSWDFGDGATATGAEAVHAYATPGNFVATLSVTDGRVEPRVVVRRTALVTIHAAPTPTANGPYVGTVGIPVPFSSARSRPPHGTPGIVYEWDFGDGAEADARPPASNVANPRHAYREAGTYDVTLRIVDTRPSGPPVVVPLTTTVVVNPEPEAHAEGPAGATVGEPVQFSSAGSSPAPDVDGISYTWDLGDGTTSSDPAPAHTYTAGGDYEITLTVVDSRPTGQPVHVEDSTLLAVNTPPVARDAAVTAVVGEALDIDLGLLATDEDGTLDLAELEVTGPDLGTLAPTSEGVVTYTADATDAGLTASFTYRVPDDQGAFSNTATVTITIVNAPVVQDPPLPPQAFADSAQTDGEPVLIDVLANDILSLGTTPVVTLTTPPLNGIGEVIDNQVEYTPQQGFEGEEVFTYQVCIEGDLCDEAEIEVLVRRLCDIVDGVARITFEPETPAPGSEVTMSADVEVPAFDATCGEIVAGVTLDGEPWGTLTLGLITGPEAAFLVPGTFAAGVQPSQIVEDAVLTGNSLLVVPEDAGDGEHVVRLMAGQPVQIFHEETLTIASPVVVTTTISETSTTVIVNGNGTGGLPVVPVVVALLVGLGMLPVLLKKRAYAEPCPGEERRWEQATREAEQLRSEADRAESRAIEAEALAADLAAELAACEAGRTGMVGGVMAVPFLGGTRSTTPPPIAEGLYLEDNPNPYAPERDGPRGWFGLERGEPIRGIVIHSAGLVPPTATTAGEAAQELAHSRTPVSIHAVVDDQGVTPLLADQRLARHSVDADQASLGVLYLAGADRASAARHLAAWCQLKASEHGVPLRRIGADSWRSGEGGLLDAADLEPAVVSLVDWTELVGSESSGAGLLAAVPLLAGAAATDDDCADLRRRHEAAQAEAAAARTTADSAAARAEAAAAEASGAKKALDDCQCRHPQIIAPVETVPQETTDEAEPSRWFLLQHQNRHGGQRGNGRSGWYYPQRQAMITGIVVHTAESNSAAGVAGYLSKVSRPASAHVVVDEAGPIDLLPDHYVAFHAAGGNSTGLGIEIAYKAAKWGSSPAHEERLLRNSAAWCAVKCVQYGIPVRRVGSVAEWKSGTRGFIAHAQLDPSRRSDPGANFPWDHFFELVEQYSLGSAIAPSDGRALGVTAP